MPLREPAMLLILGCTLAALGCAGGTRPVAQADDSLLATSDNRAQPAAARTTPEIRLESPAFSDGQPIHRRYTDYGEKISPELTWGDLPEGTQSLVILMEDPDADEPKPFVHWVLYNLPVDYEGLRRAVPTNLRLEHLGNALQGRNSRGSIGYFGPRPPKGDPPHRYFFQIFALDRKLDLQPGATKEQVLQAMRGHVLARGSTVGQYSEPK